MNLSLKVLQLLNLCSIAIYGAMLSHLVKENISYTT